jgi:hypothetical protein
VTTLAFVPQQDGNESRVFAWRPRLCQLIGIRGMVVIDVADSVNQKLESLAMQIVTKCVLGQAEPTLVANPSHLPARILLQFGLIGDFAVAEADAGRDRLRSGGGQVALLYVAKLPAAEGHCFGGEARAESYGKPSVSGPVRGDICTALLDRLEVSRGARRVSR